jgi:CheY-like chemotaxis protein
MHKAPNEPQASFFNKDPPDVLRASILIVDDQKANILLLEQLLADVGYCNVASTMKPKEVSRLYQQYCFDLILLDLQMPGCDGFEVMAALKANAEVRFLPVIVLTAQPGQKLRALQAGARDFISKPFDLVEVRTRIHNMLEVQLLYKRLEEYSGMLEQQVQMRTEELRESEARFRSLTELATDWYWEQDSEGSFTRVSGPVLDMLGIRVESFVDTEQADDSGGNNDGWDPEEQAQLHATLEARQPFLDLILNKHNADGTHQQFRVSGEPMFNRACAYVGYRGVGVEITTGHVPAC